MHPSGAARLDLFTEKRKLSTLMYPKRYKGMFLSIVGIVALYAVSFYYGQLMQNSIGIKKVRFSDDIVEAAKAYGVHPALITAVIHAESNFDPMARSYRGAKGLMQINPPTQRYLKLENAYDPSENIMAGAKYLKELIILFNGNTKLVLAAYNAGPGAVRRYKGIPPYNETRNYVKKVLVYFDQYRKTFISSSLMS
ncbi:MAG: lytic transglycosylase domain-containing protein [Deltaproteobacteria bacterium]|jgi:soluble lytic murein transglycosylase-like protein|nr:lytic transglycosylase domain-containing protein [Deltaproteobacteria bacterium]